MSPTTAPQASNAKIAVRLAITAKGADALAHDMAARDAWLAGALHELTPAERGVLALAAQLMERIATE
jgi:hypothetical protein